MQNGYLYYVNEENGTFEYIGRTSWERENEYFGTLTISGITHCSYYLVTAQELTGDNVVIPEEPVAPVDPEEPVVPEDPEEPVPPVDPEDTDDKQPIDTEQTQDQDENKLQEDKSPQTVEAVKTGDSASVLPVAAAVVLSLAVVLVLLKKKVTA